VKPPKAKPKVQTSGHELSWPLDLDGHSVKPPKVKPQAQRKKEHPTLFIAQNNPSNLMTKILSMNDFSMKKFDGLSTKVWVSIIVKPKLPWRVRHFGKKVSILNCVGF
jgi:hypothetical protein